MPLQVHTARINIKDPDRLDITRKSGTEGLFLAPSWNILGPALLARKSGTPDIEWWGFYVKAYLLEMRDSYRKEREKWEALLAQPRVVICCYCNHPEHCHRHLLRTRVFPKLGAVDCGEIPVVGKAEPREGVEFARD